MLHRPERLLGVCLFALTGGFLLACNSPVSPGDPVDSGILSSANNSPVVEQHTDVSPLGTLVDADIDGEAWLTRTKDGISLKLMASGDAIEAMDAFTIWAVIFNNPNGCVNGCGGDDLGRPSAGAMVLNFGGGVDMDGDAVLEMVEMEASLDRNSTAGKQVLVGDAKGVRNTYKVEVHVILRNHGMKESDPGDLADQTSLVGAFCNLSDARDTDGILDNCSDQGLAIFGPVRAPGAK